MTIIRIAGVHAYRINRDISMFGIRALYIGDFDQFSSAWYFWKATKEHYILHACFSYITSGTISKFGFGPGQITKVIPD